MSRQATTTEKWGSDIYSNPNNQWVRHFCKENWLSAILYNFKTQMILFSTWTMPYTAILFAWAELSLKRENWFTLPSTFFFLKTLEKSLLKIENLKENPFLMQALLHKFICSGFPRRWKAFCVLLILNHVLIMQMTKLQQCLAIDTSKLNRDPK